MTEIIYSYVQDILQENAYLQTIINKNYTLYEKTTIRL